MKRRATDDRRIPVSNRRELEEGIERLQSRGTRALVRFCGRYIYTGAPIPQIPSGTIFCGTRFERGTEVSPKWCHWIVADDVDWMTIAEIDDLVESGYAIFDGCPIVYVEEFDPRHHPKDFFDVFAANALNETVRRVMLTRLTIEVRDIEPTVH